MDISKPCHTSTPLVAGLSKLNGAQPNSQAVPSTFMTRTHQAYNGNIPWPKLQTEICRLVTFRKYPLNCCKSACLLAKEGFAYNGSGADGDDSVICYFCGVHHKDWRLGDIIQEVHRHISPNCPMACGTSCDNASFGSPSNAATLLPWLESHNGQNHAHIDDISWPWLRKEKWRILTFCKYPSQSCNKHSTLLAAEGFAYIGSGGDGNDSVICCFCKVTLRDWGPKDNINRAHKRFEPNCPMACGVSDTNEPFAHPHNVDALRELENMQRLASTETKTPKLSPSAQQQSLEDVTDGTTSSYSDTRKSKDVNLACHVSDGQSSYNDTRESDDVDLTHVGAGQSSYSDTRESECTDSAHVGVGESSYSDTREREGANLAHVGVGQSPYSDTNESVNANFANVGAAGQCSYTNTSEDSSSNSTDLPTSSSESENEGTSRCRAGIVARSAGVKAMEEIDKCVLCCAKHTRYVSLDERKKSFPREHRFADGSWASAGFFFAGCGDCVCCFHCDGGLDLENVKPDEDPWVEHASRYPHCVFVRLTMGEAFIDTVQMLKREQERVSYDDVMTAMRLQNDPPLTGNPSGQAEVGEGFPHRDAMQIAQDMIPEGKVPSQAKLQVLQEIRQLQAESTCIVCTTEQRSCVFLPCGHLVCCGRCAVLRVHCPVPGCERTIAGLLPKMAS